MQRIARSRGQILTKIRFLSGNSNTFSVIKADSILQTSPRAPSRTIESAKRSA